MNKFLFTAFSILFIVTIITIDKVYAQQKDSTVLSTVDSLMNPMTPQDSAAFGILKNEKKTKLQSTFDSLRNASASDTLKPKNKDKSKNPSIVSDKKKQKNWSHPKKAMVLAMLVPGAGQIYNHKYWKLPILYAGAGALTYFWITNQQLYSEFKHQYKTENDQLKADPSYQFIYYSSSTKSYYTSVNQLASDRDTYRRYRDNSIAGCVALYAISILDAYVDAHLSTFSISPDLSFSAKPLFYKNNATFVTGVSLNFQFKNNRTQNSKLLRRDF